jgi:hypothetical protein
MIYAYDLTKIQGLYPNFFQLHITVVEHRGAFCECPKINIIYLKKPDNK